MENHISVDDLTSGKFIVANDEESLLDDLEVNDTDEPTEELDGGNEFELEDYESDEEVTIEEELDIDVDSDLAELDQALVEDSEDVNDLNEEESEEEIDLDELNEMVDSLNDLNLDQLAANESSEEGYDSAFVGWLSLFISANPSVGVRTLAAKMGVSRTYLQEILDGKRYPVQSDIDGAHAFMEKFNSRRKSAYTKRNKK